MAGESVARVTVDDESYLADLREVSVQGADDGRDREGLDFDAGGVVIGEGAVQIDHRELAGIAVKRCVLGEVKRLFAEVGGGLGGFLQR